MSGSWLSSICSLRKFSTWLRRNRKSLTLKDGPMGLTPTITTSPLRACLLILRSRMQKSGLFLYRSYNKLKISSWNPCFFAKRKKKRQSPSARSKSSVWFSLRNRMFPSERNCLQASRRRRLGSCSVLRLRCLQSTAPCSAKSASRQW